MKIQLVSDIHLEFYSDPIGFLESLTFEPNLDVLISAGDIVVPAHQDINTLTGIFSLLSSKAKDVIYVTGNHSYYHSTKEQTEATLRSVTATNFHWLDNSEVTIEGQHFYGGTAWFKDDPLNMLYERNLSDFHVIKDLRQWVYTESAVFTTEAWRLVRPDTIVVSHHLPSDLCVAPQFKGSPLNRFFVNDHTALILEKKPKAWLCGHSHIKGDITLGDTRLLLNPFGYPDEVFKSPKDYIPVVLEY